MAILDQVFWRFKRTFNSICPQFCSCFGAKSFRCLALIFLLSNQCLPATSASTNRCHFLRLHQVRCIKQKWSKNRKSGPEIGRPLSKICDPSALDRLPWLSFRRCPRRDLNPRPLPYQGSALPLSYKGLWKRWAGLDLNQRRRSQRIYSPPPLTTRAPTRST